MATKKKIVSSTGGVPTDALPESPFFRREARPEQVDGLTVGGQPIPENMRHLFPYANTDQGIAEREAEREAKPRASASVTRDQHYKSLERFGDSRLAREPWEGADVMQEIIDAHLPEGHRPKFLSDRVVKRQGLRGWKPVEGAPRYADMTFASMPEEKAIRRNRTFQSSANEKLTEIHNEFQVMQERDSRDAGMRPSALRAQRDGLDTGLHSNRGEFAE